MDKLGFKEGEMIEASMINKGIERAQKKVEEINFGVRKRLLEYDDVMNKQRTVIYEKRRHALMGERIGMDISNMIWDRVVSIIDSNDYAGCRDQFLEVMAMDVPFSEEEFDAKKREDLFEPSFQAAMENFKRRIDQLARIAMPVITKVYEEQGQMYENILVPISDGRLVYNIRCNLKEAYESECRVVVRDFEKAILLHNIDDAWKENLRELDELRKSVQNASYEQKDPLLIFKLESVKLFDAMVNKINNSTTATLMRCQIRTEPAGCTSGRPEQRAPKQKYTETHEDLNDESQQAAAQQDTRKTAPEPIVKEKVPDATTPAPAVAERNSKTATARTWFKKKEITVSTF